MINGIGTAVRTQSALIGATGDRDVVCVGLGADLLFGQVSRVGGVVGVSGDIGDRGEGVKAGGTFGGPVGGSVARFDVGGVVLAVAMVVVGDAVVVISVDRLSWVALAFRRERHLGFGNGVCFLVYEVDRLGVGSGLGVGAVVEVGVGVRSGVHVGVDAVCLDGGIRLVCDCIGAGSGGGDRVRGGGDGGKRGVRVGRAGVACGVRLVVRGRL
ncbi:hypothetical protein [Nonomuraea sp. NPDC052265]|uniref:hypothetical protein n=1 Tax=Nonomuraea sp. NPDC052265 TaxID=3364374 RepID=UPI0037C9B122